MKKLNRKIVILFTIGILGFVLLIANYHIMQPIAQEQYLEFKRVLNSYGLIGDYDYYGSIDEAMEKGGLVFNNEWKNLYDSYNSTMTEIYVVSIIFMLVTVLSFSFALYKGK